MLCNTPHDVTTAWKCIHISGSVNSKTRTSISVPLPHLLTAATRPSHGWNRRSWSGEKGLRTAQGVVQHPGGAVEAAFHRVGHLSRAERRHVQKALCRVLPCQPRPLLLRHLDGSQRLGFITTLRWAPSLLLPVKTPARSLSLLVPLGAVHGL